jgi:hypothetical protein
MAIDPHNLPESRAALHQIVLQLLQVAEDKDRLLERVQRQLEQLLRQRYGPKRERLRDLFSRISSHPTTGSMSCFRTPGMPHNQSPSLNRP